MPVTDPRIDAYIANAAPFARPILEFLRKAVHAGCPGVRETIKWGAPHFDSDGMLCGMAAFSAHVRFGFWKGQLLAADPKAGSGRRAGNYEKVRSLDDLPPERTLVRLVKQAAALNEKGVKPARKPPAKRPAPRTPPWLMAALRERPEVLATFSAFSPSHKREYIEWLTDAKTDATRERRVAQALAWLAEGKPRNWKYM